MRSESAGPLIIAAGVALAVIGLLVSLGWFGWFGRLPGDIRIERESLRVYFPFASMIVVSLVLSLAFYVLRRFL